MLKILVLTFTLMLPGLARADAAVDAVRALGHVAQGILSALAHPPQPANESCAAYVINGAPVGDNGRLLCKNGFLVEYATSRKSPTWVAEKLTRDSINGRITRDGIQFVADPAVPGAYRAQPSDYTRSGFDRGHLASAGNFRNNAKGMSDSFLMSNIVPQDPEHNRSIWANLEASVRELTARRGELYVVSGPVYTDNPRMLKNGIPVPDALFKVLIHPSQGGTAFVIPNRPGLGDNPDRYQVTIRTVEKLTGINFNPLLPKAEQDRIELNGGDWLMPKVRVRFKD